MKRSMTMKMRWLILTSILAVLIAYGCTVGIPIVAGPATVDAPQSLAEAPVLLPNVDGSFKFVVLGDFGTGGPGQYEVGTRMARFRDTFKYDIVITVGDNIYGGEETPEQFTRRFENPYKELLDGGVKFYATLGNHDAREQRFYKLFNMNGEYYYTLKAPTGSIRFFMFDSTYRTPEEIVWFEKELLGSTDDWKILVLHHPLYSSGGRHGSDLRLRNTLEPLLVAYNVSIVFAGHDHFYERIKPQLGIMHFVVGSGGQLAFGDINRRSTLTAKGFDTDNVFLAVEIAGDRMYFNAISREGLVIDSGIIERRMPAVAVP